MCIEVFKEELAWAIDKWFQFTICYYTIPLETCKEAIGYYIYLSVIQTILVIQMLLKMEKYTGN